jgi:hypothetical protein
MNIVTDENVDVIYVSPLPVNEEMAQYYNKLLGLQTAIISGNVEEQCDLSARFKIITPEAINSFPVGSAIIPAAMVSVGSRPSDEG